MRTFTRQHRSSCARAFASTQTFSTPPDASCQRLVRRILRGSPVQAKLTVGAPDDVFEQEADHVADEVMRMPEPQIQAAPT